MQKRKLGKTELELTTIGLGTWAIGGPWQYGWGTQDDRESIATIQRAVELGINWIDTAPIYGCGHSEEIVGQALRPIRQKPMLATKCGLRWNAAREKLNNLDPDSIRRECEESLTRLGIDRIDLYQMHWPIPDEHIEKAWEAMARCVEQKMISYLGACNVTIEQIQRLKKVFPVAAIQPPYSMLKRGIETGLLDYCGKNNIGVVCYSPMQKGLLTGKFNADYLRTLSPNDHRLIRDPNFQSPRFENIVAMVDELKKIAADCGKSVAQLAIAWVLRRPEVTSAIIGARRPDQIEQTAPAGNWTLEAEIIDRVEDILKRYA
ncbi:MAG TPA: aldo/keto reductase [Anaerohalosphaeraceae bacterium]|nr:aldo/keto reductase [Anaerohalosphaeraceae bacterium]